VAGKFPGSSVAPANQDTATVSVKFQVQVSMSRNVVSQHLCCAIKPKARATLTADVEEVLEAQPIRNLS
jgi:hypothetical protein